MYIIIFFLLILISTVLTILFKSKFIDKKNLYIFFIKFIFFLLVYLTAYFLLNITKYFHLLNIYYWDNFYILELILKYYYNILKLIQVITLIENFWINLYEKLFQFNLNLHYVYIELILNHNSKLFLFFIKNLILIFDLFFYITNNLFFFNISDYFISFQKLYKLLKNSDNFILISNFKWYVVIIWLIVGTLFFLFAITGIILLSSFQYIIYLLFSSFFWFWIFSVIYLLHVFFNFIK